TFDLTRVLNTMTEEVGHTGATSHDVIQRTGCFLTSHIISLTFQIWFRKFMTPMEC
ncbi:hypothetical protein L9F63_017405, partial [Diploptera punctata]